MGLVIRQSIYTTLISYVGVIIGYINLLYLYPKFLAPEQVGLLRTIQDAAILFSPFAQFGLAQSIFKFYPQLAKDKKTEAGFISTMLLLAGIGFSIFFIAFKLFEAPILSYFEDNAKDIIQYTSAILWLTLILLLTAILEAYSRSLLKTIFPNLVKEVVARFLLALLVVCYFQGWLTYNWFIIGTVLAYLLCLLILVAYLFIEKSLQFNFNLMLLRSPIFKELARYSLLSFAGAAGMIIIGKIDSLMVAAICGLTPVAVYTTGFYMATVIEIPKRALSQVAFPLIARAFEKDDLTDIARIYQKTSINQFIIGSLLLIGVYVNLDNIFEMMPKQEVYEAGKWVVIIVGVGKLADMLFGPSSEIIVLSRYYWFNMVVILFLAATVIIANQILIPRYGINGAAMGAAIALISFNSIKFLFVLIKLKMQPFTWATLKVLAIAATTLGLNLILPKIDFVIADIFVRSTLVSVFFGGLILISKATPDGNILFGKALQFLKLKN
jgi:O-antigen/teichoic acid export membrane protein